MNVPHTSPARYATSSQLLSSKWLVPLVVVPIVGFAIYIGWLLYQEFRASSEMNMRMTSVRAEGPSPENAWLAQRLAETTSSAGTAAWSEILMLSGGVGWNAIGDLPILGNGDGLRKSVPSGTPRC